MTTRPTEKDVATGERIARTFYPILSGDDCQHLAQRIAQALADRAEEIATFIEAHPYDLERKPSWLSADTVKAIAAAIRQRFSGDSNVLG